MSKVGMVLDGKYEILKEIGQGGMSIVYVAMDNRLNKQWAVKELKNDGTQSVEALLKGIEREANILKKVDHPVLPRIVDIMDKEGTVYVVMDYIQGLALDKILKEQGAQPQEKVIEWAKQLASALDYLHSMNPPIIYRDMKPSNVMLQPDGRVKLIDFGTAKEYKVENIADTTALGTRGYAAPEQFGDAQGHGLYKTDARTDIYCLGATMYHIVTGMNPCEPPYEMRPIREWNPGLSSGLENILLKCTQPNPNDRYQSCSELIYALEHYQELDNGYRKKQRRHLALWGASVAAMLFSVGISAAGYRGIQNTIQQDYRALIEQANNDKINGDYTAASETYVKAITQVDGTESEAYLDLLSLYVNYMDAQEGLSRLGGYIDSNYENIQKNSDVVLEVALTYFDELHNYKSSLKYFQMLEEDDVPEAYYYKTIASTLSELNSVSSNVDFEQFINDLEAFEEYNDGQAVSESKLLNYKILADIYITYENDIPEAPTKAIRVTEKGLLEVENIKDDTLLTDYSIAYDKQLASAYQLRAEGAENTDSESDYEAAISYCNEILGIVSKEEDADTRCSMMCNIAKMYEEMGKIEQAEAQYETAISEFGTEYKKVYIGYLQLLCAQEQAKDSNVENWDVSKIFEIYDKGTQVSGIDSDITWKKLKQKLEPLFSIHGR